MMKSMKAVHGFGLLCVALLVASCTPQQREQQGGTANATAEVIQPSLPSRAEKTPAEPSHQPMGDHWVQSDALRTLMKDVSQKMQRNWPQGVPRDPEDRETGELPRAMDSAATLADGLAAAAVRIPGSVRAEKMNEADGAGFRAEADTLRDQSLRLGQAARAGKVEQMQEALDAISSTCISCHSRYRDFSGELNMQRVSAR